MEKQEKKVYVAPLMEEFDMDCQTVLCGSCTGDCPINVDIEDP